MSTLNFSKRNLRNRTINPLGETDPYWSSTKLLITGNGLNNGTNANIYDQSPSNHTITKYGDVYQGSFCPFPVSAGSAYDPAVNGGSVYFDGAGDYCTIPHSSALDIAGGDYTVECWVYVTGGSSARGIVSKRASNNGWTFGINNSTPFFWTNAGSSTNSSISVSNNTWAHIAIVGSGGSTKIYVNGVLGATAAYVVPSVTHNMTIGSSEPSLEAFTGYIANLHVIKGYAKYTTGFTPSAISTAHANTVLLINATDANVRDETGLTNVKLLGDTKLSNVQHKYYDTAVYFDGTGDYALASVHLGSADFTVEFWAYMLDLPAGGRGFVHFFNGTPSNSNLGFALAHNNTQMVIYTSASNTLTWTHSANQWYHIAASRSGSSLRIFVDGVLLGTITNSTDYSSYTTANVGIYYSTSYGYYGYLSDLRVTRGVARYTSNFTPPSQSLPRKSA